ncbi:MAG: glycosyltransferase, partial [Acidobacteriota bacterium]
MLFGPGAGAAPLEQLARAAGCLERIEALGELAHPQALAVIRSADVFVRPTLADGDAISVREALVMGVPCVA